MKRKKIIIVLLTVILTLAVLATAGIGRLVYSQMSRLTDPQTTTQNTMEHLYQWGFDLKAFQSDYDYQTIAIDSTHSKYTIPTIYVSPDGETNRDTVIMIHGMGGTKEAYLPIGKLFLELGYNVVAYDQANSGESQAKVSSMGVLESYDALDVVEYVATQVSEDKRVILWGCSYGGLTAAIALGRDDLKIDLAILDSPMSDGNFGVDNGLAEAAQETSIPAGFMKFAGGLWFKLLDGVTYRAMDATKWLEKSSVPVLIIHSPDDQVTPYYMAEDLMKVLGDRGRLVETSSVHGEAGFNQPEDYKQWLQEFLDSH